MGIFHDKHVVIKKQSKGADNQKEDLLLTVDVTNSENYNYSKRITNFPVETGFKKSDHEIREPIRVTINGIISDTPLGILRAQKLLSSNLGTTLGMGKWFSKKKQNIDNYSQEAFRVLEDIYKKSDPVTLTTGLKNYSNMIMEKLVINRTSDTIGGLPFEATFKELLEVTSKSVEVTTKTKKEQASDNNINPIKNKGKTTTQSVGEKLIDGVSSLFGR